MKIKNTNYNNNFTTRYVYGNEENEYVFVCKGRPFAVLVSPLLPTPTSNLLDYDLVRSLGLKLTDLQCRKFIFAGRKLRILGRVSTAVQCVQNGKVSGTFHIKGLVVSDLYTLLDTHCVASARMKQQIAASETLVIPDDDDVVAPSTPPRAATPSPSTTSTPSVPAWSPRTPPGFPPTPQYCSSPGISESGSSVAEDVLVPSKCLLSQDGPHLPADEVAANLHVPPYDANIYLMDVVFNKADLQTSVAKEKQAIISGSAGPGGKEDTKADTFTFTTKAGYTYKTGHGRNKCTRARCELQRHVPIDKVDRKLPNNCGLHEQWSLPDDFWYCGLECRGGFCDCLRQWERGGGS